MMSETIDLEVADEYADCESCLTLQRPTNPDFVRPRQLHDLQAIKTWPDLLLHTDFKHKVDPGSILANYNIKPGLRACSLNDNHQHGIGSIVKTRCGLVISLGWKCAGNSVHGYGEADAFAKEAETFFQRIDRIKRIPWESKEQLEDLIPELEKADHFRNAKKGTAEGREMLARATSRSPKAAEVTVKQREFARTRATDLGDANVREVEGTESIKALEFWTIEIDLRRFGRALAEAEELIALVRKVDEKDEAATKDLDRRCGILEGSVRKAKEVGTVCSTYFAPGNQALVRLAVQQARAGH